MLHIFKTQLPHSGLVFQHRWRSIAPVFGEMPGKCENIHSKDPEWKKRGGGGGGDPVFKLLWRVFTHPVWLN